MTTLGVRDTATFDPAFGDSVEFVKYTSFGNNFFIVDETSNAFPSDEARSRFARWALNRDFGMGGTDNVLFLRPAMAGELSDDGRPADYVFRIFEWDGSETLSCGNGLLSTAAYLHRLTGGDQWAVLTELPSGQPKLIEVGTVGSDGRTWVNLGWPRPVSAALYQRAGDEPANAVDEVPPLTVPLPREDWADGLGSHITLHGLLTFSGEPHLVLLEGRGYPTELSDRLWIDASAGPRIGGVEPDAVRRSRALVHHLGSYVNEHYRHYFPEGVHLNFVRPGSDGALEYRTWERAINCETLACGTGTVSIMHALRSYGLVTGSELSFWPHRCRWYEPDAALTVREAADGFHVAGWPKLVCTGTAPQFPLGTGADT